MTDERPEPRDALGHVIDEGEYIVAPSGAVYEFAGYYRDGDQAGAGYICIWRDGEFIAAPVRNRTRMRHERCVRVADLELLRSAMVLRLHPKMVHVALRSWVDAALERAAQR